MIQEAGLLIDLTQFMSKPARSGIQRVLVELVHRWSLDIVPATIGYRDSEDYLIVSFEGAKRVLRSYFDANGGTNVGGPRAELDQLAISRIPAQKLANYYSAYLLPELTFNNEILDMLRHWRSHRPHRTFAIFYDALPQTNPELFCAPHQMPTSRYFREVASVENVACISRASLDCLVGRLRRQPALNAVVLPLGTDPFPPSTPKREPAACEFVLVGTVEPRKNHAIVLAAFDDLWRCDLDYRLHFVGARGLHTESFLNQLSHISASHPCRLRWSQHATDNDIRNALADARAAIFVSEAEGYGLPAMEALAAGCPLIAAASLPALEGVPSLGQVRLDQISVDSVKTAVERMADPDFNSVLRQELTKLRLPTWESFTHQFVQWIRRTLDNNARPKETLRIGLSTASH